ncbi:G2 and S phase-expressed protein 1 [Holothuria leucospilota]|uniref:G2 and S phase-expressed protein 1 n=1 Tax=Holothuria leucospilota TaxID=206669 RepID=A0A9Q1CK10_HOLLE|nr:G2 and S phase-expressed protein 1 [Holothuria leucospilota]
MDVALPADTSLTAGEQGFIDAETFDFNLSVSPENNKEANKTQEEEVFTESHEKEDEDDDDDDEVYLGPVSFKEKCVATRVELVEQKDSAKMAADILTAEQYVELFKEANAIALELGKDQPSKGKEECNPQVSAIKAELDDQALNLSVDLEVDVSDTAKSGDTHLRKSNQGSESDGLSVIERYRRLTKKNVRSPRRDTYVIGNKVTKPLSAGNASSKLPTRQSKLRSGLSGPTKPSTQATGRKSQLQELAKLPPMKQTVNKTVPAVPASTRLSSSGSQDGNQDVFNSSSSSSGSNCSVSSLPCLKRPASSQGRKMSRLKQPQATKDIGKPKKNSLDTLTLKPDANGGGDQPRKVPTSKPSLLKPSGIKTRSSGLTRLKPSNTTQNKVTPTKRKSQPMKATLTFEKASKSKDTSVPPENGLRSSLRKPSTPGTPCGQDKPLLPRKRILSSASSCRTVSRSSSSELDSSVPSSGSFTPMGKSRRKSCLPTPSSSKRTSARRRSGLPTPSRRSQTDTQGSPVPVKRYTALSPVMTDYKHLPSSKPIEASPALKNPAILGVLETNILDLNSPTMHSTSPDLKPMKISKMDIEEEGLASSPAVGMLINLNDLPTKSVPSSITKQLFHQPEEVKENLIDF